MKKHTITLKSLDYIAKPLWNLLVFFPPANTTKFINVIMYKLSLLSYLLSSILFSLLYLTWLHIFHSKQAWTGWNTIPCSHVAPQHTAGREASYSQSQGLTAKATLLSHNRLGKQSFKDFLPQHSQAKGHTEVPYMTSLIITESSMHQTPTQTQNENKVLHLQLSGRSWGYPKSRFHEDGIN